MSRWGTGRGGRPAGTLTTSEVIVGCMHRAAYAVIYAATLMASPLADRRLELLPVAGQGSAVTETQGRGPDDSLSPAGLVELVSSIGALGMLQPILVEELPGGMRRLVAGERRLRAARLGRARQPGNEHFAAIPALVCAGPLSETERRTWQVVENLARSDLQPGELAEALLYQRCALLEERLREVGVELPQAVTAMEDPVVRFQALDQLRTRAGHHRLGAPWRDVLRRLGVQMGEDTARRLVRAFARLPVELSCEMDEREVALATRLEYIQLGQRDGEEAAGAIWEAVKEAGRVDLLRGTVRQCLDSPSLGVAEALSRAEEMRTRTGRSGDGQGCEEPSQDGLVRELVDADVLARASEGIKALLAALRAGGRLKRYDAGSLQLWTEELLALLARDG